MGQKICLLIHNLNLDLITLVILIKLFSFIGPRNLNVKADKKEKSIITADESEIELLKR